MPRASFGSLYKMELVSGYMISVALRPGKGIDGNFYVYVMDRVTPPERPNNFVSFKVGGQEPKDTLVITGDGFNYTFKDIYLSRAVVTASLTERLRLFEFHYPSESTDKGKSPVELSNTSTKKLDAGLIGDDLRWSVEGKGSAEFLYGASAEIAPSGKSVVRLDALRNKSNSILEKLIETNAAAPNGGMITAFRVECGQLGLKLGHDNLEWAFVTEAFGTCLEWKRPALTDYLALDESPQALVRARMDGPTRIELLERANAGPGMRRGGTDKPMQSATFCMAPGAVIDPQIA